MSAWRLPDPVAIREIENEWIVMPDGVRLAVSLWLPDGGGPAPVVLEYIPYRKRDSTRGYSGYWGRLLARQGVAYARLDARGSGDSEGSLADEYLPLEQADAVAAIAWLAARPWCNGAVGMRGVSWGGFITLQVAALAPPALKAIMPMCASDRRYTDDAHYVGGVFALTGLKWATSFKVVMAGPPDPEVFGVDWEAAWMRRLDAAPPIAAQWLRHQREDDYWRQGSVGFDPAAIRCPTYLAGGWADPYNAAIPRLLERLSVPTKAVIGPWGHGYPQPAAPGPGLRWIDEEVRWWRHWLADEPTGVMEGPRVWAYLPEQSPAEARGDIPGRWVAPPSWPPRSELLQLHLSPGRLGESRGESGVATITSDPRVGLATPEWCPFSWTQYPREQSADDAHALTFDTEPLEEPMEMLGTPVLRLRLAADRPVATLAARLLEVTPDGRSWLVTYGALNLTHRGSHDSPTPLTPGEGYDIELSLYVTARRFRVGSRLRLALSEGLWPLLWPSPEPVTLTLDLTGARLALPVRSFGDEPEFPIGVVASTSGPGRGEPEISHDTTPQGLTTFREVSPSSRATIEAIGTTVERFGPDLELSVGVDDPSSCRWRARQGVRYLRGDWDCAVESDVEITADAATFHVRERVIARRGEAVVFDREVVSDVPRDLM
jgi:putative CocE/NonD family hydrolase